MQPETLHSRVTAQLSTGGWLRPGKHRDRPHRCHMPRELSAPVRALLHRQDGVVSRRQLLSLGLGDNDIEVLLRRRELEAAARGVYRWRGASSSWSATVWAAVLRYAPAAASGRTCLALHDLAPPPSLVEVVVAAGRRVSGEPGIRVQRSRLFGEVALLDHHPPRVRLEHATLEVAATISDERRLVALVTDVVRSRRTTSSRLAEELARRSRMPHRRLLAALLADAGAGVQSVLEQRYRTDVERAHGLPPGRRQAPGLIGDRSVYRDVEYLGGRLVIELDGRIGHEQSSDRWRDAERDLATVLQGGTTLRATYGQVLEPCRLAALVAHLLRALGWRGTPSHCGPTCTVADVAGSWRVPG